MPADALGVGELERVAQGEFHLRYSIRLIGYLHVTVLAGTGPSLVGGLKVHVATVVDTPLCTTVMTALVKAKS